MKLNVTLIILYVSQMIKTVKGGCIDTTLIYSYKTEILDGKQMVHYEKVQFSATTGYAQNTGWQISSYFNPLASLYDNKVCSKDGIYCFQAFSPFKSGQTIKATIWYATTSQTVSSSKYYYDGADNFEYQNKWGTSC